MSMKRYIVSQPYLPGVKCRLGESVTYDEARDAISWVDINESSGGVDLHTVNLSKGPSSHSVIRKLSHRVTKLVDVENPEYWGCAMREGVGLINKTTGRIQKIANFWNDEENAKGEETKHTSNDGMVDSRGRFWVGMIGLPLNLRKAEGSLWCMNSDMKLHKIIPDGITVSNGISFSPDDKTLYFTDTRANAVFAFDFNVEKGTISNKRVFFDSKLYSPASRIGGPDGHAMDAEGHLWITLFGVGKIVRVSPKGTVTAEIQLPTRCVTDCAFAGEDLFIVTSTDWWPKQAPHTLPFQGCVFKCSVGVQGLPWHKLKLPKDKVKALL